VTDHDIAAEQALRELLADSFGRVRERVAALTDGLTTAESSYRPDDQANSVGWLVWHLTRVQDDHVADLAGTEQAWTANGWYERFGLPFDAAATGYAHSSDEVDGVRVDASLLDAYHDDVYRRSLDYVGSLTADELSRVVDEAWDPPVTASVRLVSILDDCQEHVGQAAYLLPIARRAVGADR
jgi:hypothetical protein